MVKVNYNLTNTPEMLAALRAMGIETHDTTRVVVVIDWQAPPILYVERFADRQVLDIMAILVGDTGRIRVDREPPDPRTVIDRLRALCRDRQTEAVGGGMTNTEEIWASEILSILDGQ